MYILGDVICAELYLLYDILFNKKSSIINLLKNVIILYIVCIDAVPKPILSQIMERLEFLGFAININSRGEGNIIVKESSRRADVHTYASSILLPLPSLLPLIRLDTGGLLTPN